MLGKPMFVKRKKFTKESTAVDRMMERWDQQVFLILKKSPQAEAAISSIRKNHEKRLGATFTPSEESLAELADLQVRLSTPLGM